MAFPDLGRSSSRRACVVSMAALMGLIPVGCQNAPAGDPGARIDPYRRTQADFNAPEADSVTLLEFADQCAQRIAQRISEIEEITKRPARVVIELGDIDNRTKTPTSDFEIVRRRVFASLVNSGYVRKYADIVESPEMMDRQHDRLASKDPANPAYGADRYKRDDIYVLQGYFGEIVRGQDQSSFYFEMSMTQLGSRRIVFVEQMDSKQVR